MSRRTVAALPRRCKNSRTKTTTAALYNVDLPFARVYQATAALNVRRVQRHGRMRRPVAVSSAEGRVARKTRTERLATRELTAATDDGARESTTEWNLLDRIASRAATGTERRGKRAT